jgi:hypothetical protein
VPKPLSRLLRDLSGVDRLLTDADALPPFDLHCPMLSLPLALQTTLATVPRDVSCLRIHPSLTRHWAMRLAATPKPRVGIAWAGNPRPHLLDAAAIGRVRSVAPDRLAPVFQLPRPCCRWLGGRRASPWYPTMRLYQQPAPGDWEPVVAEIVRDPRTYQAVPDSPAPEFGLGNLVPEN